MSPSNNQSFNRPGLMAKRVAITAFFALLIGTLPTSPVVVAAQPTATPATTKTKTPTNDEQLAQTLDQIERTLHHIERKLNRKHSAANDKKTLKGLHQSLNTQDQKAIQSFKEIEKRIKTKNLPAVILERHQKAVTRYTTKMATLKANLEALENAKDKTAHAQALTKAISHLTQAKKKEKRKPHDPKHNPHRALQPKKNNKPKTNKKAFHTAGLFDTPYVKLAAHGNFDISTLPGADDPAFLAATPEVKLSNAIKAKAAELEHNPVKIFNWVHDHTEWLPTFGAIQNSGHALLTQKGNAFDLSSLLIALYRASGIPARYVHGTIDIPADRFMNWMGGFSSPEGALDLAANSGLPINSLTAGGKIVAFRLEHVWVEAALDFAPSRGAINKAADTWVRLDPSFKQYEAEPAYDMHALLNFDGDRHFQEYFNDPADLTPYQFYSKKVIDYLNTNQPDWTLKGLYGHERIRPVKTVTDGDFKLLAASLPYTIKVKGYSAHEIPDVLRHKVTIGIANDPNSAIDAQYSISLPELGSRRLTVSYIPESSADNAVAEDYGSLYSAPAYLVRVKPQFRLDGQVVATGLGIGLGEKHTFILTFQAPTLNGYPVINKVTAGAYSAVVVESSSSSISIPGGSMQKLQNEILLNEIEQAKFDGLLGQLLQNIGAFWFFNLQYERNFYSVTTQVGYIQLPSEAIVTADLVVHKWFGIPKSVDTGIYTIDVDIDVMTMGSYENKTNRKKDFMILAGLAGSSWEHLVFENIFDRTAVSAVKLLKTARQQGIPIFTIDVTNINQVIPQLSLSVEDIIDIKNAVNAGNIVTVSKTDVLVDYYRGVGYTVLDPETATGPYMINGGLAGGAGRPKEAMDNWEKYAYDSRLFSTLVRALIVNWSVLQIGTPYGFGCKYPFWSGRKTEYGKCSKIKKDDPWWMLRVDCSGLIAYAYGMVGFPFFHAKAANDQMNYIGGLPIGSYPSTEDVKIGDLNFWCCTQKSLPDSHASHVGIYLRSGTWIAAQGNMVGIYSNTKKWEDNFIKHGSVLKY